MSNKIVIIAAGGFGSRLQSNLPKQYHLLDDKPVLMHTILAFCGIADRIVVAIHANMIDTWQNMCLEYGFKVPHELVEGGETRFQTVRNAIQYIAGETSNILTQDAVVAIHDAARPLVSQNLIDMSFKMALDGKCNVLAVKSINSVRIGDQENSTSIDRDTVWQIQTPQTFPVHILLKAFKQNENPSFTDDASVVEQLGYPIYLLESNRRNIKLTYKEDFKIALLYINEDL